MTTAALFAMMREVHGALAVSPCASVASKSEAEEAGGGVRW